MGGGRYGLCHGFEWETGASHRSGSENRPPFVGRVASFHGLGGKVKKNEGEEGSISNASVRCVSQPFAQLDDREGSKRRSVAAVGPEMGDADERDYRHAYIQKEREGGSGTIA